MQKRKLWILIESMSQEERKRFPHWLKAELGDRQTYLQQLCHILSKAYPKPPQRENIWQILYPNTSFDDARLRKLTRDLTGWVEEFFAIEQFRSQKDEKAVALLRALYDRDLADEFEKGVRKFDREMEKRPLRDGAFFKLKYELEREVIEYQVAYRQQLDRPLHSRGQTSETDISSYQRFQDYFDLWWISTKLEIASTNQAKKQITGQETDSVLLSELLALIPQNALLAQEPFLRLYREMTLLLIGDESIRLEDLLKQIQSMAGLAPGDLQTLWVALINYNVRALNQTGDPKFAEQSLILFEWAISSDFLLVDGYLPEVYYKNLIAFCIRSKQFDKAEHYLEYYKPLLREERREDVYLLNIAIYHSTKNDYEKVIQMIGPVRLSRSSEEIQARTLLLQAFYEVSPHEVEWLLGQLKNLDRYIRSRQNMSDGNKKPLLNRLRLFRALLKADSKKDLEKLLLRIQTTHPLNTPLWLIEKTQHKMANAI
ncbi:MAG: hypothetical protein AB8H47_21535 [Bacteroidia bacterium]